MYASLLYLLWGVFFKVPSLANAVITLFGSAFLFATAVVEEKEDIRTFGAEYSKYMKVSKRFIPYVL